MDHPAFFFNPILKSIKKTHSYYMVLCFVRVCIDKTQVFVEAAQSQWLPKDCLNAFTTALEAELRDPKGVATKIAKGPRVSWEWECCFRVKPVFYKNLI